MNGNDNKKYFAKRLRRMMRQGQLRAWRRRIGVIVSAFVLVAVAVALSRPAITMGTQDKAAGLAATSAPATDMGEETLATPGVAAPKDGEPQGGLQDGPQTGSKDERQAAPQNASDATMGEEPVASHDPVEDDGTMGEEATSDSTADKTAEADDTMGEEDPTGPDGLQLEMQSIDEENAARGNTLLTQGNSVVTGLLVKDPDVPGAVPNGAQLAKRRSLQELENGGTYVVYGLINNKPFAIGKDGSWHEMARASDGNNIYATDGDNIDQSLLWFIDKRNTVEGGVKACIKNLSDENYTLYPRNNGGRVVETGKTSKAFIRQGNNDAEFYVCDNGGTLGVCTYGTDDPYVGTYSFKELYFAEVPTEAAYTATQVTTAPLLEGYYVMSRSDNVNANTTGVTALDYMNNQKRLNYQPAKAKGSRQIGGFLNSCIWYVKPVDGSTNEYVIRNVWSGERLSPNVGTYTDTVTMASDAGAFRITSQETGNGLRHSTASFAYWTSGADRFFLYRVDNDGFYHTYFDTSLGANGFYRYSANSFASHVQYTLDEVDSSGTPCHTITLPTAEEVGTTGVEGSNKPYRYRLSAWVDMYGHAYYSPGSTIRVYGNKVFYPEWFAETYSIGQPQDLSAKSVYMPAITTSLFDYNEIVNVNGLTQLSNAVDDISATGHSERWRDSLQNDSFLFIFNDGQNKETLHNVNGNVRSEWNASHSYTPTSDGSYSYDGNYNGKVTEGILGRNPGLRDQLFNQYSWMPGKTYVGDDHCLYSYDYDTGYYYYDSNRNAASYNQRDGRFYVYNYTNRTNKSRVDNADTWKDNTDFLPLNYGVGEFNETYGEVNYWFGMKTEFYFFLPNDATTDGTKNKSIKNEDMAFRFSGDDDVWVLVDDQLVLDLGGIHGTVYGEINFSRSSVTTGQIGAESTYELKDGTSVRLSSQAASTAIANDEVKVIGVTPTDATTNVGGVEMPRVTTSVNDVLAGLGAGNHKLTFLYLERGSSESNAAIYFNIAPVYQVNLTKVDGTGSTISPLTGAKFKVYTDAACTKEAENVSAYWGRSYDATSGFQDTNGSYYLDGFVANQDYYIKELESPAGYSLLSGPVKLSISGDTCTCTYYPTNEQGQSERGQVVCVSELEGQGDHFPGVYGGFAVSIPNYTSREIPAAGGCGTGPFIVVGVLLAGGAAVLLVRRHRRSALLVVVVALVGCALVPSRVAMADEVSGGAGTGSLTVAFEAEGMPFKLYSAGDVPKTSDYDELALQLAAEVAAKGTAPLREGVIGNGVYDFGNVENGWYLLVGEPTAYDGYVWSAVPTLARVPGVTAEGKTEPQVTVHPKWTRTPQEQTGKNVEHRLVKQWVSDSADVRPSEVRIALVHGGEVAQTVTLNGDNNWSYAWTCADDGVPWTAVEQDVPSGYKASVRTEGNRITVQNVRQSTGGGKVAGGTNGTSGTNAANDENAAPATGSAGSTSLATTGDNSVLTPMAVVLAAVGVLAIVLGWTWRMRSRAMMVAGMVALLAAGGLVCWGVRAEAAERQACDDALADLVELLPETTQGHVSGDADAPLAVMAVDGRDLVGYLDMGSGLGRIPVHAGTDGRGAHLVSGSPRTGAATISNVDVALDKVHAGDTVSFVDVDGVSYDYVIDAVAQADASAHDGMVLQVPGMAEGAALICKA